MRVAAFQNGYFTALCNRVGKEDCLDFAGESFVCGPDGDVIARGGEGQGRDSLRRHRFRDRRELTRAAVVPEASPPGAVWRAGMKSYTKHEARRLNQLVCRDSVLRRAADSRQDELIELPQLRLAVRVRPRL